MARISSSILYALLLGIGLNTHTAAAQDRAQVPKCASVEGFGRLDFWLGEWQVESGGQVVGSNRVVKVQAGCAIEEHWTDAEGGTGQSLFYYLPAVDEWHQVWVTPNAAAAGGVKQKRLVEQLEDGGVRFQGTITRRDGTTYLDRTTLRPLPDGTVSQHIQLSADDGQTWSEGWSGIYHRIYPAKPRSGE